jgi:hypothetical protein
VYFCSGAIQFVGFFSVDETALGRAEPRLESDGYAGPCSAAAAGKTQASKIAVMVRALFIAR